MSNFMKIGKFVSTNQMFLILDSGIFEKVLSFAGLKFLAISNLELLPFFNHFCRTRLSCPASNLQVI